MFVIYRPVFINGFAVSGYTNSHSIVVKQYNYARNIVIIIHVFSILYNNGNTHWVIGMIQSVRWEYLFSQLLCRHMSARQHEFHRSLACVHVPTIENTTYFYDGHFYGTIPYNRCFRHTGGHPMWTIIILGTHVGGPIYFSKVIHIRWKCLCFIVIQFLTMISLQSLWI